MPALYQEDVRAQFEDPVDAGKLLKHDGVADPAEELSHELPDHQHHRGVQSHNTAATETGAGREEQKLVRLYWRSYTSAQEAETRVLYPYPARKPRLGGLTLSLNTRSCSPASRLLLTDVLPPTGTKLATGWSTIHHSWISVL